jgi:hypothetical protein
LLGVGSSAAGGWVFSPEALPEVSGPFRSEISELSEGVAPLPGAVSSPAARGGRFFGCVLRRSASCFSMTDMRLA